MRLTFYLISAISLLFIITIQFFWPPMRYALILWLPYTFVGIHSLRSTHNILRNYPVLGHLRYFFEFIRPEIQQYFINSNVSGRPYSREMRSVVYQRAKQVIDTLPFGSQHDVMEAGYVLAYHSLAPKKPAKAVKRVTIGAVNCQQPYAASRLNISAMSFGALGERAVRTLNLGAKLGNFAQNTGEGGLSPYHLQHGGDIIWQIGTAYFGCRDKKTGGFDAEKFAKKAQYPQVKMIEIKLSQGAKPSHGGVLPGEKVSAEIADIRGIEAGKTCVSPAAHRMFSTPEELLQFVVQLRELSGGKPVGFKLCIGIRHEFMAICKAMLSTGILPDFITVDGSEGGTGAAPLEFINRLGTPINEAIAFVHSCLLGIDVRDKIKIIASGKVTTGFDMVTKIALGADTCNAARTMMFAIGCIQALSCNTNKCPTGVTTQDPWRQKAIVVEHKAKRVRNYHDATLESFLEIIGALGLEHADQLTPHYILERVHAHEARPLAELYPYLEKGDLLKETVPPAYAKDWQLAQADRF